MTNNTNNTDYTNTTSYTPNNQGLREAAKAVSAALAARGIYKSVDELMSDLVKDWQNDAEWLREFKYKEDK